MKKMFCVLLIALTLCFFTACGSKNNAGTSSSANDPTPNTSASQVQSTTTASESGQSTGSIDVDLTILSSTMVYSEVYNMMNTPDSYIGKTVKMQGQFGCYEDPDTKNQYFACIIADATACCSQGLEFILTGEHTYPDDYPTLGSEITVTGTFELYEENGYQYCRLADAALAN